VATRRGGECERRGVVVYGDKGSLCSAALGYSGQDHNRKPLLGTSTSRPGAQLTSFADMCASPAAACCTHASSFTALCPNSFLAERAEREVRHNAKTRFRLHAKAT
jgi:hypothetical protein